MDRNALRAALLAEAESWVGTPFHHMADVKGQGVDCGMLVLRVFQAVGLLPPAVDPRPYPVAWCLHRAEDRFTPILRAHCVLIDAATPAPGDVACFRVGRAVYGHIAIALRWPLILHAAPTSSVLVGRATHGELAGRFVGAWRHRAFVEGARG